MAGGGLAANQLARAAFPSGSNATCAKERALPELETSVKYIISAYFNMNRFCFEKGGFLRDKGQVGTFGMAGKKLLGHTCPLVELGQGQTGPRKIKLPQNKPKKNHLDYAEVNLIHASRAEI